MNDNQFAPPKAHVADVVVPRGPQPKPVQMAVRLLWAGFAVGVIMTPLWVKHLPDQASMVMSAIATAVFMSLIAVLYVCILRGRNWARNVWLCLTVLNLIVVVLSPHSLGEGLFLQALSLLNWALTASAAYLLFIPQASRAWFRPGKR